MVKREMKLRTVLNITFFFFFFESYWAFHKSACFSTDYNFVARKHWGVGCYSLKEWSVRAGKKIFSGSHLFFFFFMPYRLINKTNLRNLLQASRIKYLNQITVLIPEILIIVSTFIWNRFKVSSIKNSAVSVVSSSIFRRHQCLIFRHKPKLHSLSV